MRLIITLLLGCLLWQPALAAPVPTENQLKQELKQAETRDPDLGKVVLYQLSYSRPAYRWWNVTKFFIGTGCALYEKSFLSQAPESKKTRFLFDCRLKRQIGELSG